ncbi:MAG: hypothetical protein ACREEM_06505 [Blastocatellia bacterium]
MNANQIYSQLKDGRFREAFDSLRQGWQELRWEIRSAVVAVVTALLLVWIYLGAGFLAVLLTLPLIAGALIAAARPAPVAGWVDGLVRWADGKRQQALAKGTFFAKWVMRPFYASLSGSSNLTAVVKDPYLRAGATITLQSYAVYLALLVAYIAISVVLALACLAFFLWIFAYAFSESSGGGHTVTRAIRRGMSGRSEEREDLFGRQFTQHYDDRHNPTGRTEQREDIFGRPYQQHISPEGDYTGHSEEREGIFGNRYTQHSNEQGEQAGHSEEREDIFGRKYTQHLDEQGNPSGHSEEREDIFGRKYTKHEEE